ncbi:MAG: hypothetical protein ABI707_11180 [Ferruginibacter sp.]
MIHHKKAAHHNRPYKIAAQTAGLVACIFIFFFIAGKGGPEILKNEDNEWVPFLPLLLLAFAGYIITWYKELAGTLLMTAGGIILLVFLARKGDTGIGLVYGLPFILAGIIYLVHIYKRAELKRKEEKKTQ